MSLKYLGPGFDMHGGSEDLIFPHHENEIAQSEAATGRQFVRFWVHTAFVTVDGSRMGKSMGNLRPIREVAASIPPESHPFLAARYPLPAADQLQPGRLGKRGQRARAAGGMPRRLAGSDHAPAGGRPDLGPDASFLREAAADCRRHFQAAMDDDLNTALALAALYDLVREANRVAQGKEFQPTAGNQEALGEVLQTLDDLGGVLGIWFAEEEAGDRGANRGIDRADGRKPGPPRTGPRRTGSVTN